MDLACHNRPRGGRRVSGGETPLAHGEFESQEKSLQRQRCRGSLIGREAQPSCSVLRDLARPIVFFLELGLRDRPAGHAGQGYFDRGIRRQRRTGPETLLVLNDFHAAHLARHACCRAQPAAIAMASSTIPCLNRISLSVIRVQLQVQIECSDPLPLLRAPWYGMPSPSQS